MRDVQLVRLDPATEEAFACDEAFMQAMATDDWDRVADCVHRRIGRTLSVAPRGVDELHWGGYFAIDKGSREVVGSCAFKGPPAADGSVEIAYFTYPDFAGRGYATAMATRLIALAGRSPEVRRVIAHTMPGPNASSRVLQKVGMRFDGEVIDPEDGPVWRWQIAAGM